MFDDSSKTLTLRPIGVVHSPFRERMSAPRQPSAARGVTGTLELFSGSGVEYALDGLETFRFIWVLFWFHENQTFKPKVQPPRSPRKYGVFATRSPYRPNPIGLSVVELLGIQGRRLEVRNLDILDQTPILDLKPYLPYTDAIPDAGNGWLDAPPQPPDPLPSHEVAFAPDANRQLEYLAERGVVLREAVEGVLRLGPEPHAYRRIKRTARGFVLAYKAWRFEFIVEGRTICVTSLHSGYRPSALYGPAEPELEPELALHRSFAEVFTRGPSLG